MEGFFMILTFAAFVGFCKAVFLRNQTSFQKKNLYDWAEDGGRNDDSNDHVKPVPEFRFFTPTKINADFIRNSDFDLFNKSLKDNFDKSRCIVFIIHGYLGGNAQWPVDIKNALVEKENCNVFIVNWSGLDGIWYGTAKDNVKRVGRLVGSFIEKLKKLLSLDLEKVHIVGHSLGAHVSGFAGKWLLEKGYKIGRITGLDPAGPEFNSLDSSERLSHTDAAFVDVIHTNWAEAFKPLDIASAASGFGLKASIGHFDFYPNGGEDQPGCKTASEAGLAVGLDAYEYLSISGFIQKIAMGRHKKTKQNFDDLACSHSRAQELFYWSIRDKECQFTAEECSSWEDYKAGKCVTPEDQYPKVQMGYYSDIYKERIQNKLQRRLYLSTTAKPPYCLKNL